MQYELCCDPGLKADAKDVWPKVSYAELSPCQSGHGPAQAVGTQHTGETRFKEIWFLLDQLGHCLGVDSSGCLWAFLPSLAMFFLLFRPIITSSLLWAGLFGH